MKIAAVALLAMLAFITISGLRENVFKADVAVVLGNEVYSDDSVAPNTEARLNRALDLYNGGYCKYIIVSGGIGVNGVDEATAMANYLTRNNVPMEQIILDKTGKNTAGTALATATLMEANNFQSAIIVTEFFHIPRTFLAFKRAGIDNIGTAYARYWSNSNFFYLSREVLAYSLYFLDATDLVKKARNFERRVLGY